MRLSATCGLLIVFVVVAYCVWLSRICQLIQCLKTNYLLLLMLLSFCPITKMALISIFGALSIPY